MRIDNKKGFTLIELLVVISIVSLLSSIILVSIQDARAKGRDAAKIRSMLETRTALQMYFADKGYYPPMSTISAGYGTVNSHLWKTHSTYGLITNNYIKDIHPEIRYIARSSADINDSTVCSINTSTCYAAQKAEIYVKLEKGNSVLSTDTNTENTYAQSVLADGVSQTENCSYDSAATTDNDLCFDLRLIGN